VQQSSAARVMSTGGEAEVETSHEERNNHQVSVFARSIATKQSSEITTQMTRIYTNLFHIASSLHSAGSKKTSFPT